MDARLPQASILFSLEAQVAHHGERESLHVERETFCGNQVLREEPGARNQPPNCVVSRPRHPIVLHPLQRLRRLLLLLPLRG
jgi:hypothetical protein